VLSGQRVGLRAEIEDSWFGNFLTSSFDERPVNVCLRASAPGGQIDSENSHDSHVIKCELQT
jgi:hypothetical protein